MCTRFTNAQISPVKLIFGKNIIKFFNVRPRTQINIYISILPNSLLEFRRDTKSLIFHKTEIIFRLKLTIQVDFF